MRSNHLYVISATTTLSCNEQDGKIGWHQVRRIGLYTSISASGCKLEEKSWLIPWKKEDVLVLMRSTGKREITNKHSSAETAVARAVWEKSEVGVREIGRRRSRGQKMCQTRRAEIGSEMRRE
ncbi:uncharacterized protein EDB91DRAFT_1080433 [Suillus paluster]|uniref:uncharacterized protein n=1 Tax=Suillus paluster TaxID=48578 RepID=UPI001B871828|nr:uncharacterized protein EDB91DRAFT_1080433 [Suillus paluster]KAG1745543.1 hypothetical protein EDB91DRAFT_1080433 [Suillus paluster]